MFYLPSHSIAIIYDNYDDVFLRTECCTIEKKHVPKMDSDVTAIDAFLETGSVTGSLTVRMDQMKRTAATVPMMNSIVAKESVSGKKTSVMASKTARVCPTQATNGLLVNVPRI